MPRVKDNNPLGTQKTVSLDFNEEYAHFYMAYHANPKHSWEIPLHTTLCISYHSIAYLSITLFKKWAKPVYKLNTILMKSRPLKPQGNFKIHKWSPFINCRCYMAEILQIRRKTLYNQSINQSINHRYMLLRQFEIRGMLGSV